MVVFVSRVGSFKPSSRCAEGRGASAYSPIGPTSATYSSGNPPW